MFRFLYDILFTVVMTLLAPRYLLRMWKRGGYRKAFLQRFGLYASGTFPPRTPDAAPRIWLHAVSVGEMFIALRFLEELRLLYPGREFVISTNTSTGHALAARRLTPGDTLVYFPLDLSAIVNRVFKKIDPGLIVLVECELWPNLTRAARCRDIPVVLVNARLSDRSFAGYRRIGPLFRRMTSGLSAVFAQTPEDAGRFKELGLPAGRICVAGNVKYDLAEHDPDDARRASELLAAAGIASSDRVVLGGSTWPGEEECLMDILPRLRRAVDVRVVLTLAPRHVERCAAIAAAARRRGLTLARRTALASHPSPDPPPDVLLIDTTGELRSLYAAAAVVFVGKSLTARGGQNPIEPAAAGATVILGPHTRNFAGAVADFRAAGAIVRVRDGDELERSLIDLLRDPERCASIGQRAAETVRARRGAIARTLAGLPAPKARAANSPSVPSSGIYGR